jgi:hypothetical protein
MNKPFVSAVLQHFLWLHIQISNEIRNRFDT